MTADPATRKKMLAHFLIEVKDLTAEEQRQFDALIHTEQYKDVLEMYEAWLHEKFENEERQTIRTELAARFGSLDCVTLDRLANWPERQLPELREKVKTAATLRDVELDD